LLSYNHRISTASTSKTSSLSGIASTSRSSNNRSGSHPRNNNYSSDDISIPTIDSDYKHFNSNFSLSDAGGTIGSQSRFSHATGTASAFGSQLSPPTGGGGGGEDSVEKLLYNDVYMREHHRHSGSSYSDMNSHLRTTTQLSHLIQPPTSPIRTSYYNGHINHSHNNYRGETKGEETIIIYAPKGKLGVVIDTPHISGSNHNKTMPIVHAIKDTCPIRDKIIVGDKLIKVDDEDVTDMTAVQVSALIGKKSEQEKRKLTIVRTTRGGGGRGTIY
jgi:hypothetical protein